MSTWGGSYSYSGGSWDTVGTDTAASDGLSAKEEFYSSFYTDPPADIEMPDIDLEYPEFDFSGEAPGTYDAVTIDGSTFMEAYDNMKIASVGGYSAKAAGINVAGAEKYGVKSLSEMVGAQWDELWTQVDDELKISQERDIQTLKETVMTDWGDQWSHGIAALSAKGLSRPDESTTSDYWQEKWTDERAQALSQGVRSIMNTYSQQRLQWKQFGLEMATDWGKFDISTGLSLRGQDVDMATAEAQLKTQASIASAANKTSASVAKAQLQQAAQLAKLEAAADIVGANQAAVNTALRDSAATEFDWAELGIETESDWALQTNQDALRLGELEAEIASANVAADAAWHAGNVDTSLTLEGYNTQERASKRAENEWYENININIP